MEKRDKLVSQSKNRGLTPTVVKVYLRRQDRDPSTDRTATRESTKCLIVWFLCEGSTRPGSGERFLSMDNSPVVFSSGGPPVHKSMVEVVNQGKKCKVT